mgnify:CR=1 FL=1
MYLEKIYDGNSYFFLYVFFLFISTKRKQSMALLGKRMWCSKGSFGSCGHSAKVKQPNRTECKIEKSVKKMLESGISALVTQRLAHPISNQEVVGSSPTRDSFFVRSLFPNFMNIHCPCPPKQRQKSLFQAQKRWIEINSVCDSNNHIIFLRF